MLGAIVLNVQMRFQGNAFFSMIGIASGAVINIALDPLFIYGFGLGVSGAALATICSQAISFGLLLGGSFRGGNVRIRLRNFSPDIKHIKPIALGGLPSLCRQGLGSVASILMNVAAKTYGGITPEAGTIVKRIPPYGIPYGITVSADVEGLMLTGRCAGMDAVVMSSARVMPICMAIGEGAGVGAALAVKYGISPRDVDVQEVRAILKASGVMLEPEK